MAASTKAPSRWRAKARPLASRLVLFGMLLVGLKPAAAQTTFNRWDARPVAAPEPLPRRPAAAATPPVAPAPTLDTLLNEPRITVERMPVFPGGQDALVSYIRSQLRRAKGPRAKGEAQVKFTVLPSGAVAQVEVLPGSSLSAAQRAELARVVGALPRFAPGQRGGQVVAMPLTVLVTL